MNFPRTIFREFSLINAYLTIFSLSECRTDLHQSNNHQNITKIALLRDLFFKTVAQPPMTLTV